MTAPSDAAETARYVTGSTMRHVIVLAGTGAIGLIAVFGVDLLNLFYISRLGQRAIAAAIGFAGAISFLQVSFSIGMTIGVGALVSRQIGAGHLDVARRLTTASLTVMAGALAVLGIVTVATLGWSLSLLGAEGETRDLAAGYLRITAFSLPLLGIGMGSAALLRSLGDARRAMDVTLIGAMVTASLDPLLILVLHLGLHGAAISTMVSRLSLALFGLYWVARRHNMMAPLVPRMLVADARQLLSIAGPAILTNLATPVGAVYVTRTIAGFGPEAVAGQATIDRITPVAFGLVYALSGAIGPIVAQNLGAGRPDRIRETLRDALAFVLVAVVVAWIALALAQNGIVVAFSAHGVTADLVRLFCSLLAGSFLFTGALYVANAAFNNLGFPLLSTVFNWGRATLGTIPFAAWGSAYGPRGVLIGQAAGSLLFGVGAMIMAFRAIDGLGRRGVSEPHRQVPVPNTPSGSSALITFTARADESKERSNRMQWLHRHRRKSSAT
ncbi:MAG: MATE family efflux transporter [Rhodopila sp.]|jgi:Na+-driven multidrug efflux pump